MKEVSGFSKLSKLEKIDWLKSQLPQAYSLNVLPDYWLADKPTQKLIEEFSENTIGNFILPFGVAPNFLIDGEMFAVPYVIEESSVVAASAKSAKFWLGRGGFVTKELSTIKNGQVHFFFDGDPAEIKSLFEQKRSELLRSIAGLSANMEKRGGGVVGLELKDMTNELAHFYQLVAQFETCDAMGANFINTILEKLGQELAGWDDRLDVNMCILSNYTPECKVKLEVSCRVQELAGIAADTDPEVFAQRFKRAVDIAQVDVRRAVTHNKGIFNGVDAVILATGNDFRAIEACGHAYAARDGQYRGLSYCELEGDQFTFGIDLPLALGTVGGLTTLHPMAKVSLEMLGSPDAPQLMKIVAAAGLAQNFGALRSLVTTGIQKGHMKMHLLNILNQLNASKEEIKQAKVYFTDKTISFSSVREFLAKSDTVH